jgi:hypothetical protein
VGCTSHVGTRQVASKERDTSQVRVAEVGVLEGTLSVELLRQISVRVIVAVAHLRGAGGGLSLSKPAQAQRVRPFSARKRLRPNSNSSRLRLECHMCGTLIRASSTPEQNIRSQTQVWQQL